MDNLLTIMFGLHRLETPDMLEWGDELFVLDFNDKQRLSYVINQQLLTNAKGIKELPFFDLLSEIKGFSFVKGVHPYLQVTLIGGDIKTTQDRDLPNGLYRPLFFFIGQWLSENANLADLFADTFNQIEVNNEMGDIASIILCITPDTPGELLFETNHTVTLISIIEKFIEKMEYTLVKEQRNTIFRSRKRVYRKV